MTLAELQQQLATTLNYHARRKIERQIEQLQKQQKKKASDSQSKLFRQ